MAGFTGIKKQEDIKNNEENKKKKIEEKKNSTSNKDIYSESTYEEAKSKYGQGVGNNKYFMPKEAWEKGKTEQSNKEPKKEQSLVANQFADKKGKTWNDVLTENENDPVKMSEWLNNHPEYKAGELTKKGMAGFGYSQDESGKWVKDDSVTNDKVTNDKVTNDKVIDGIEGVTTENEEAKNLVDGVTNPETGDIDTEKAKGAVSKYEKKLVEMGAASYDENGNFVLKDVNAKGWEDWATVLSAGLSVLGLAFGVPIIPINFRKITNKDERDAKIMELQQQYMDIKAENAGKVEDVISSAEAGNIVKNNKKDIDAFLEYGDNVAGYKAKSDIDTDKEIKLINENLKAEMTLVDQEFANKIGEMKLTHEQQKEMQELMSKLSTDSAKELVNQQRYGYILQMAKDMKNAGMDDRALALKLQSLAGNTPTAQNIKHAQDIAKIFTDIINSDSDSD